MRNRLIDMLEKSDILCKDCGEYGDTYCCEAIAEYLVSNGVIVPPCKVGDMVYSIKYGDIIELVVRGFSCDPKGLDTLIVSRKDKYQRCTFQYNKFDGSLDFIKFSRKEAEFALINKKYEQSRVKTY